jgi:hypothetical protein
MLPILGSPDPAVAVPVAVQARLDHLFRNNVRDNNQDWATGTLRRYVEAYRFARAVRP